MMSQNLDMLEVDLIKKNDILDKLQILYNRQEQLLKVESLQVGEFDSCMEKQDSLLEELLELDAGFETLCKAVKSEISFDKSSYAVQIERIQQINKQILNKSMLLQEKEASNKEKLEQYIQKERKNIGAGRRSSKAALDYYKSMSKSNVIPPHFMDKKK